MRNLKTEQIAAANYPYFKYSLEYALDSLERMGAARMEFYACYPHLHVDDAGLSQVRAVKRQLEDHHLTPICFTPEQCLYPVNIASRDVNARKRSLDVYVKSMDFAAEMDIELCQFLSGFGCLDEMDEDIWKRAVESVAYLGRIAQGYGITIALETSPKEYTVTETAKDITRMIEEVGCPAVKGMIDTATLGFADETMEGAIADLGPYLRHVHVGDGKPNGHFALGEGELNLPHMIDELDKAAYPYYLSLEILNNLYTRNPEYAMKKSYDWLVGYISGSIRPQEG